MAKLVRGAGRQDWSNGPADGQIHRPLPPFSRTVAIASCSLLRVPVGRLGRILTLLAGARMPHVIAGASFATFEILTSNALWSIGNQPVFRPNTPMSTVFMVTGPNSAVAPGTSRFPGPYVWHHMPMRKFVPLLLKTMVPRNAALEFTSYSEVCLNNRRADMAHPAFAKLFVETEYDRETGALFARRRPRDAKEKPIWGVHVSASSQGSSQNVEYETDRAKFLGRGRTAANPAIFDKRCRTFRHNRSCSGSNLLPSKASPTRAWRVRAPRLCDRCRRQ